MPSPRRSLIFGLLALLPLTSRAGGQEVDRTAPPAGFVEGWHVVRPGETLERIATRYLGNLSLWRELHRLNPGIVDPDLIEPGQRIRVFLKKGGPAAAQVQRVARRVEEQPSPHPWSEA
ncbi:MAG: LysM peptidoglycan-binding domain-containing protein, partial [Thermoanaerobaculia bacterium]